jgi:iron complex outermembrane receptor protein
MSITQKFPAWHVRATVGIRNLFDETPPAVSTGEFRIGTSAIGNYDMIGRQAFVTVSKSW